MPVRVVPGTDFSYHLIAFDEKGAERPEGGVLTSREAASTIATQPVTDVVLLSHGWNGDIPAAIRQYERWMGAMLNCEAGRQRAADAVPGFRALVVGLHWPSKAWGDEELGAASYAVGTDDVGGGATVEELISDYAFRLGDAPATRAAVRTVVESALENIAPDRLPPQSVAAYRTVHHRGGLGASGAGPGPRGDPEPLRPHATC